MRFMPLAGAVLIAAAVSCIKKTNQSEEIQRPATILDQVDLQSQKLEGATADFKLIANLDHHRMAQEEGAYTPPAIVRIFSDAETNSSLLSDENQLVALDLPYKILCYAEADTAKANIAFTSGAFISKRHGIPLKQLLKFKEQLNGVLDVFDKSLVQDTRLDSVSLGFGIIKIQSDYDFDETVSNLVEIVNNQSDTRWFGEIDFRKEAMDFGKVLNPTVMLLFGGPAPGAKAMQTTPRIGLDAFCQKLLVYKDSSGEVWIAFNDIVAFSKLYYGKATKPQNMINQRLAATFSKAVKKPNS